MKSSTVHKRNQYIGLLSFFLFFFDFLFLFLLYEVIKLFLCSIYFRLDITWPPLLDSIRSKVFVILLYRRKDASEFIEFDSRDTLN